jgi:hypothetical protein
VLDNKLDFNKYKKKNPTLFFSTINWTMLLPGHAQGSKSEYFRSPMITAFVTATPSIAAPKMGVTDGM